MELDPNDMSLVQGMKALNVGVDSTQAKAKGDEAFKAGRYDEAATCYTTAIQVIAGSPQIPVSCSSSRQLNVGLETRL